MVSPKTFASASNVEQSRHSHEQSISRLMPKERLRKEAASGRSLVVNAAALCPEGPCSSLVRQPFFHEEIPQSLASREGRTQVTDSGGGSGAYFPKPVTKLQQGLKNLTRLTRGSIRTKTTSYVKPTITGQENSISGPVLSGVGLTCEVYCELG